VPIPLRYWMASSRDLTAQVHTIIRTTIAQYYINQAVSKLHIWLELTVGKALSGHRRGRQI